MREIPLDVLFTFPSPNYDDPETRGPGLIITIAVFTSLVTIAIALRYYTRIALKRWYGLDDVFIGLAYITTIGLTVSVVLANLRYGWNRHVWDVETSLITPSMKIAMAAKVLFLAAATCTRLSLLCFYNRLLGGTNTRWFTWALWASTAFVVSLGLISVFMSIFLCNPVKAYWVFPPMKEHEFTCIDEGIAGTWLGGFNTFADLLITVLPIPVILRLQMPRRQRIGVIILLSLGFVVTIAGALRTYYLWLDLVESYDVTWLSYPLWISATVEIYLGLICACVPAIRPLLVNIFSPSIRSLGGYIKSFISNASTATTANRPTHSSSFSSSTAKLKTANSNKSYQYNDDAKQTGISFHERQVVALDNDGDVEKNAITIKSTTIPRLSHFFGERDARPFSRGRGRSRSRSRSKSNKNNDENSYKNNCSNSNKNNNYNNNESVGGANTNTNNKLRIEMRQTIELTTLSLTPEQQTRRMNDMVLPAALREW